MPIQSKEDLKKYILKSLGSPVINIEIDQSEGGQMDDRIDDAISFFIERHYLGVEETFFKKSLSYKDLLSDATSLPPEISSVVEVLNLKSDGDRLNNSGIKAFDSMEYQLQDLYNRSAGHSTGSYYIMKENFSTLQWLMTKNHRFTYSKITEKFQPLGWSLNDIPKYHYINSPAKFDTLEWNKINSNVYDNSIEIPNGNLSASSISSSDTINVFGIEQTVDFKYYQKDEFVVKLQLKSGEYNGNVVLDILDEYTNLVSTSTISLTNQFKTTFIKFKLKEINGSKITLKIQSAQPASVLGDSFHVNYIDGWKNPFIILRVYKSINQDEDVNIYNDRWIKKYATELVKKQWGQNVKKFRGTKLPGGIEIDGQVIYDEAVREIEKIEEEFDMKYELPISPVIA